MGRARARRSAVAALLASVLVVCGLVTTLITSLGPLTQDALDASTEALPADESVVEVTTAYDEDAPDAQQAAVRAALSTVTAPLGGDIVSRAEGVAFDLLDRPGATAGIDYFTFSSVTGADARIELASGRLARAADTPEVVVPRAVADRFEVGVGDRLRLRSRYDDVVVRPVVVGVWRPPGPEQQRWLGGMLGTSPGPADDTEDDATAGHRWPPLLTTGRVFRATAGPVPSIKWRAVPDLGELTPARLPTLADAVARTATEVEAAEAETGASLQLHHPLPHVVTGQQRAVAVFRSLLLVPAVLLLILGLVGLTMVAGLLAASRETEETLLRSRGASPWQLTRPTLVEASTCGALGALAGPLLAAWAGPSDGLGSLGPTGWLTGAAAGLACAVALALPSAVRAVSRRGERSEPSPREKRRRTAAAAFGLLLLLALGGAAIVQLLRYETVAAVDGRAGSVDPLLVASPGLVLVTGCVVLSLLAVPLARLLAHLTAGARGLPGPLSTRAVARAAGSAVPLMLLVACGSGVVWFAAVQQSSQAAGRQDRATYMVGADLRVEHGATVGDDSLATGAALVGIDGVRAALPVREDTVNVGRDQVDLLVTDLDEVGGTALDAERHDFAPDPGVLATAVERAWTRGGIDVPAGTRRVEVGVDAPVDGLRVVVLLADADGSLRTATARADGRRATLTWPAGLTEQQRLVGLDVTGSFPGCATADGESARLGLAGLRVDGTVTPARVQWYGGPDAAAGEIRHACSTGSAFALTGLVDAVTGQGGASPALLTAGLASEIDVAPGDEVRFTLGGDPVDLTVAGIVPGLPGVADGEEGVLLDTATVAPSLLRAGQQVGPTAWWVDTAGSPPGVVDAVRARLPEESVVRSRAEVLEALDDDPGTGGAGLASSLWATVVGGGAVCLLLLCAAALLRRGQRAREAGVLRALGAGQRSVVGVIGGEYALTAGLGALAGAAVGTGVVALVLPVVTLGPGGLPLMPPVDLSVPWPVVLGGTVALLLVPLLLVLALARADAHAAMVSDLRSLEHG